MRCRVESPRLENNLISVKQLDILSESSFVDIKPCVPEFEHTHNVRVGLLEQVKSQVRTKKSDARFKQLCADCQQPCIGRDSRKPTLDGLVYRCRLVN